MNLAPFISNYCISIVGIFYGIMSKCRALAELISFLPTKAAASVYVRPSESRGSTYTRLKRKAMALRPASRHKNYMILNTKTTVFYCTLSVYILE